ncbi:MAG TPA: YceK/YidQ family lipoprotein [Planctomycetota bacterium]
MKRVALALILASAGGCSTISTWTSQDDHPWLYSGTRWNVEALTPGEPEPFGGIRQTFAILDFPWSLALDTLALPITLPAQLIGGDWEREP